MPLIPQADIEEAIRRIERHLLVLGALSFLRCRHSGGSFEECIGLYRLTPPRPGDPFFDELLAGIDPKEKVALLEAVRDALVDDVKLLEADLELAKS